MYAAHPTDSAAQLLLNVAATHRPGIAVVLNGPSGAGKSLLMEALAAASLLPWVRFGLVRVADSIRCRSEGVETGGR